MKFCSTGFKTFKASTCFFPWCSIVFICCSKDFPRGEYLNVACYISLLWSRGSISSPARYSYLSLLPDDIYAPFLLMSYCSFLSLLLSTIAMISFYIPSKRLFQKRKRLSDAKVVSITKKKYGFGVHFLEKLMKYLNLISDEWLNVICWSSHLFEIFIIK